MPERLLQRQQVAPGAAEPAGEGVPQIVKPEVLDAHRRQGRAPCLPPSVLRDRIPLPLPQPPAVLAALIGEHGFAVAGLIGEAMQRAGIRCPVIWRGMGYRDGGEDVERFRRAVFDGRVRCAPSLLMRSALADAVCLRDPAGNAKLAKARSTGRIDAASAAVLAVAEGARQAARPAVNARAPVWV